MVILLDSDIVAYRCAATAENDDEYVALSRVEELIDRIAKECGTWDIECYIGGKGNWRKEIYPEYKANRTKPKPKHLNACITLLKEEYAAKWEDGLEADDLLSIRQHQCLETNVESTIASIDKDLLQVPGNHYNFVKNAFTTTTQIQGLRRFYGQVISGDGSDNVPSYDGKVRGSVPKFIEAHIQTLDGMETEAEMYEYCKDLYSDQVSWADDWQTPLERNASVLYMLKKRGEMWKPPTNNAVD